jgi:hypothetical protein
VVGSYYSNEQDTFTKDVMAKLLLDAEAVPGFSFTQWDLKVQEKNLVGL